VVSQRSAHAICAAGVGKTTLSVRSDSPFSFDHRVMCLELGDQNPRNDACSLALCAVLSGIEQTKSPRRATVFESVTHLSAAPSGVGLLCNR
jgi:hypothetical protein